MSCGVHLLVPIKPLRIAKSRLRAASPTARAHAELVTALVSDTVLAARAAEGVAGVVVVTSDPTLDARFRAHGVEVIADSPDQGLNSALEHGARMLRERRPRARLGVLQADLPALRPAELDAAIAESAGQRAFCADRHGTGTTLLLARGDTDLRPGFGTDSARVHGHGGARRLARAAESLRCDVDVPADLGVAEALGLGEHTRSVLRGEVRADCVGHSA
ncbi:2-phospho-L-lactate guanylyltransferase [Actinopolyspora mortivallis]|uniref:2-phospho-L-lactate guanylyltransferase n=1 Tax=Actinopolyspora mortivallis TaxID=33906 RepID=UPI0003615218|nr:2-phospho-L-lactate guanylyltransferase [Actinopolyspora mortivallis]